jgi:hypothetical protein
LSANPCSSPVLQAQEVLHTINIHYLKIFQNFTLFLMRGSNYLKDKAALLIMPPACLLQPIPEREAEVRLHVCLPDSEWAEQP